MKNTGLVLLALLATSFKCFGQLEAIQACYRQHTLSKAIPQDSTNDGILRHFNRLDSLYLACVRKAYLPSLQAKTLRSEELTDASLRGKVIILTFWFIVCSSAGSPPLRLMSSFDLLTVIIGKDHDRLSVQGGVILPFIICLTACVGLII